MDLANLQPHHYVWIVGFLLLEGVLVYGVLHHCLNPEIRNNLEAKRFNERVKYTATAVNAIAVGMFAGAVLLPSINDTAVKVWSLLWAAAALGLHLMGHFILGLLKAEDGYE